MIGCFEPGVWDAEEHASEKRFLLQPFRSQRGTVLYRLVTLVFTAGVPTLFSGVAG